MKLTLTILACVVAAGSASAQNPSIIQNTRSTMNGVSNNSTAASNQALGVQSSVQSSAPSTASTMSSTPTTSATVAAKPTKHKKHVVGVSTTPAIVAVPNSAAQSAKNGAQTDATNNAKADASAPQDKYAANGKRDPFISPVVSHAGGSGCSTGKKCLEIGEINLRGVVHSDNGFIAVVSNGLNKAYFLRENDPVFNGYVVKITGDSVVFQETLQDRLGKTFTREVVKKITTPAV